MFCLKMARAYSPPVDVDAAENCCGKFAEQLEAVLYQTLAENKRLRCVSKKFCEAVTAQEMSRVDTGKRRDRGRARRAVRPTSPKTNDNLPQL